MAFIIRHNNNQTLAILMHAAPTTPYLSALHERLTSRGAVMLRISNTGYVTISKSCFIQLSSFEYVKKTRKS